MKTRCPPALPTNNPNYCEPPHKSFQVVLVSGHLRCPATRPRSPLPGWKGRQEDHCGLRWPCSYCLLLCESGRQQGPFFAEPKLASMNVSERSRFPRARRSSASTCNKRVSPPVLRQALHRQLRRSRMGLQPSLIEQTNSIPTQAPQEESQLKDDILARPTLLPLCSRSF
jgi:hypothetical protein